MHLTLSCLAMSIYLIFLKLFHTEFPTTRIIYSNKFRIKNRRLQFLFTGFAFAFDEAFLSVLFGKIISLLDLMEPLKWFQFWSWMKTWVGISELFGSPFIFHFVYNGFQQQQQKVNCITMPNTVLPILSIVGNHIWNSFIEREVKFVLYIILFIWWYLFTHSLRIKKKYIYWTGDVGCMTCGRWRSLLM